MNINLSLLNGYTEEVKNRVVLLIEENRLNEYLNNRYPDTHNITTNKALYNYTQTLKKEYMKKAPPIHKILYDDRIERVHKALGFNTSISRVQGKNLKKKSEIHIASIFKKAPLDMLNMIVVHELAHLKEMDHNKKFYTLCKHMNSDYFQLEFDIRLFLINLELS